VKVDVNEMLVVHGSLGFSWKAALEKRGKITKTALHSNILEKMACKTSSSPVLFYLICL